jgi:alpha-beta hydrolase superfamily lysophospholipase
MAGAELEVGVAEEARSQRDTEATYTIQRLPRDDGSSLAFYSWPAPQVQVKAAVQIAHGLSEHAARYERLAQTLTRAGYAVYASDHRGHGRTPQNPLDFGFFGERDGIKQVVEDLYAVNRRIAAERPGVPRVLFGHSFGSFMAQIYLFTHSDTLSAAVLSGTNSGGGWLVKLGRYVAMFERLRIGAKNRSPLLQKLSFGSFNQAFTPARTEFDWLSRDEREVDKYVADPLAGFALTTQAWIDLYGALSSLADAEKQARIPKNLPIYIFAGDTDPVGEQGRGPTALAKAYERAGLQHVTLKLYPGARHETLNETNRDRVMAELVAWLDANVAASS